MIAEMPPPPSPADVWEEEPPSPHRCALCHVPFTKYVRSLADDRPTGLGGRLQRWYLCAQCAATTTEESMESRAARRRREFEDAFLEVRTTTYAGFEHLRRGKPDRKVLRDMARKKAKAARRKPA